MPKVVKMKAAQLTTLTHLMDLLERGKSEIFTEILDVTQEIAEELLERNPDNRRVRARGPNRSVQAYADAMLRGEWVVNGESIIVSSDGLLNDGQNRLYAVIRSGRTVPMQFTFGVERETRHTVDQGAGRRPGDVLMMAGEKNTTHLAAAVHFVWAYDGDRVFHNSPSSDQLIAALDTDPDLRQHVTKLQNLRKEFRLSVGAVTGAYHVCHRMNPKVAVNFLADVTTGLNIGNGDSPVLRLRKRYQDHVTKRGAIGAVEQAALFIKAFNAYRQGRTMKILQWRQSGLNAEDFPTAGA